MTLCVRQWLDQAVLVWLHSVFVTTFTHKHFPPRPPFDSDTRYVSTVSPVSLFYSWGMKAPKRLSDVSNTPEQAKRGQGLCFSASYTVQKPGIPVFTNEAMMDLNMFSGYISSIFEFTSSIEFSYFLQSKRFRYSCMAVVWNSLTLFTRAIGSVSRSSSKIFCSFPQELLCLPKEHSWQKLHEMKALSFLGF